MVYIMIKKKKKKHNLRSVYNIKHVFFSSIPLRYSVYFFSPVRIIVGIYFIIYT